MPAWSWWTGHILFLYKHVGLLPDLAYVGLAFSEIAKEFLEDEMFLLDLWPASDTVVVIFDPDVAVQICHKLDLPKTPMNESMIRPITGGLTFLPMNGEQWKMWRGIFNPGFNPNAIKESVPRIVDSATRFCEKLKDLAGEGVVCLDDLTHQLTFEVIIKAVIGVDIGPGYNEHILVRSMGTIIKWHSFWDPLVLMNPVRPFVQWYYGWVLNSWLEDRIVERFQMLKQSGKASLQPGKPIDRTVMDHVIQAYTAERDADIAERLDPDLLQMACLHMRLFLFVGNDTTSSTIIFAMHLLHKHPQTLREIQEEYDRIFGVDHSTVGAQLKENPALLSNCRYTHAVVKETLRLYPPAATMREGNSSYSILTCRGISFPSNNLGILTSHLNMHLNPRYWPRAEEFLPERWLVDPEHELHPLMNAWRAFELGPRNCIGQYLALTQIKAVLAMTVRTFKISPAYEEWDDIQAARGGIFQAIASALQLNKKQVKTFRGDRAFPTDKAGSHPSDGYPCRVSLRTPEEALGKR